MNSVNFEDVNGVVKNTFDDWNLLLKTREIPKPEPKTNYVDIPGGDSSLDLSEVVSGEVKYNNFTIPFEFTVLDDFLEWDNKISEIANFIHGKKMKITLQSDSYYYYEGRCSIDKFTSNKRLGNIAINCLVEPYKLKHDKTIINVDVSVTNEVNLINDRMTTIPTIICDSEINITFDENTYSLNAGKHIIPDIQFKEGLNTLYFEGTGNVTIEYQEGSL